MYIIQLIHVTKSWKKNSGCLLLLNSPHQQLATEIPSCSSSKISRCIYVCSIKYTFSQVTFTLATEKVLPGIYEIRKRSETWMQHTKHTYPNHKILQHPENIAYIKSYTDNTLFITNMYILLWYKHTLFSVF